MTTIPTSTPANPSTLAQSILTDTRALRREVATILSLAEATALPMEGESVSFLETVTNLLRMIVDGIDQNQKSLAALHARLDEPGIAMVLRRMNEAD